MSYQEFPKTLYRPAAAGGLEHRSFAREADIPADEGWTDHSTAKAAAKPAPAAPTRVAGDMERLQKQIAELMEKLAKAQAQVVTEKTAAQEIRNVALAAQERAGEFEAMLEKIAQSEGAPADVKESINALLHPLKPTPESVKSERNARTEAAKRGR